MLEPIKKNEMEGVASTFHLYPKYFPREVHIMEVVGVRKICFKCKQEKPLSEFYKHRMMRDGHLNKCKECAKSDVGKHREAFIEQIRAYDRERGHLPHRITGNTERVKRYRKENPEAYKAHSMVNRAYKTGRLEKSECAICGGIDKIEAHHEDYTKPLDVIFLCSVHHHAVHHKGLKVSRSAAIFDVANAHGSTMD